MSKKLSLISVLLLVAVFSLSTPVFSQTEAETETDSETVETTQETDQETRQAQRAERIEDARTRLQSRSELSEEERHVAIDIAKAARLEKACTTIGGKLQTHKDKINTFSDGHVSAYERFQARAEKLIARLDANSIDTATLQADMTTMTGLVDQAKADFGVYLSLMDESINFTCTDDVQEMHNLLQDTRAAHSISKSSIEAVKNFVKDTVKADIQALKTQLGSDDSAEQPAETVERSQDG